MDLQCFITWPQMDGYDNTVHDLLEMGADIEAQDIQEQTPLHYAAKSGYAATVRLLLENGADIKLQDTIGRTPLHLATENNKVETAQQLLEKGADIESLTDGGWTRLHCEAYVKDKLKFSYKSCAKTVQLLLENGTNVAAQNKLASVPLHIADTVVL